MIATLKMDAAQPWYEHKFICKVIFIGTAEPLHKSHLGGWQKKLAVVAWVGGHYGEGGVLLI